MIKKIVLPLLVFLIGTNVLTSTASAQSLNRNLTELDNGVKLYSEMSGEGEYTVVFESGYSDGTKTFDYNLGEQVSNWGAIQENISQRANTIAYDRAGVGNSSDVNNILMNDKDKFDVLMGNKIDLSKYQFDGTTKTAKDKAINLYSLLKEKNLPSPYIIVAHSLGGHTAIEFAKMYGHELAGVIFVDASGRNQLGDNWEFFKNYFPELTEPFFAQFTNADGNLNDVLVGQAQTYEDMNALRDIPITYIESDPITTIGPDPIQLAEWAKMKKTQIKELLSLSDDSKYMYVPESTHYVHLSHTQLVIEEINEFLDTRIN